MECKFKVSPSGVAKLSDKVQGMYSVEVAVNVTVPDECMEYRAFVNCAMSAAAVKLAQHIRVGWDFTPDAAGNNAASWCAHVATWNKRAVSFDTIMAPASKAGVVVPEQFRPVFDKLVAAGNTPEQAMEKINAALLSALG